MSAPAAKALGRAGEHHAAAPPRRPRPRPGPGPARPAGGCSSAFSASGRFGRTRVTPGAVWGSRRSGSRSSWPSPPAGSDLTALYRDKKARGRGPAGRPCPPGGRRRLPRRWRPCRPSGSFSSAIQRIVPLGDQAVEAGRGLVGRVAQGVLVQSLQVAGHPVGDQVVKASGSFFISRRVLLQRRDLVRRAERSSKMAICFFGLERPARWAEAGAVV